MTRKTHAVVPAPQAPAKPTKESLKARLAAVQAETNAKQAVYNKADEDLRASKVEADNIARELADLRNQAFIDLLTPELIDVLAPDHERSSCSDSNTCNTSRGCTRCNLLEARVMKYIDFEFTFEVKRTDY